MWVACLLVETPHCAGLAADGAACGTAFAKGIPRKERIMRRKNLAIVAVLSGLALVFSAAPSAAFSGRGMGHTSFHSPGARLGHAPAFYASRGPGHVSVPRSGWHGVGTPASFAGHHGRFVGFRHAPPVVVGVGLGWGWGWGWDPWAWGWGPWGWGWGWGGPWGWRASMAYAPGYGAPAPPQLEAVNTDVSPEHARVILDGVLIGVADDFDGTPDYLYLKPGHYTIEFRLGGYRSYTMDIDAKAGSYLPIKVSLERIKGEKPTPWYDRPDGLPTSRIFGPKPGQGPAESSPKPAPDPSLRPELNAPASPAPAAGAAPATAVGGALELRVTPANAAVYIDGTMVGTGQELGRLERGLAVPAGKHRIEVIAPGRTAKSVDVDVKEGERLQVVVDLD